MNATLTNPVLRSTRAELLRLRKWPALWVMVGVFALLNVMFNYLFTYVSYSSGDTSGVTEGVRPEALLADMLPAAVPQAVYQGMPMFGGAIMLILGALTVGGGYGWGTWKTVYTQGPTRLSTLGGTALALPVVLAAVVLGTFALDTGLSLLVATVEAQPIVWPTLGAVLQGLGAGLLILAMWTFCGVLVGTLARGPALAVGLGLVWVMAVENLLRGVANIWSPIERVTDLLPGTAAGSLAGALGAAPGSDPSGTPGVLTTLGAVESTWLMVAYLLLFAAVTGALVRRRDVV